MTIDYLDAVAFFAALFFGRDALNTFFANRRNSHERFTYNRVTLAALALAGAWIWARCS